MTNINTLEAGQILDTPPIPPEQQELNRKAAEIKRDDMRRQNKCQMRLAAEEFGNGKPLENMTTEEENVVMQLWTNTGYSKVWRELIDKMKAELKDGETIDYSKITLKQVIGTDPKKIYN